MKRAFIYSLIVHLILFSLAFFLKEQKKESKPDFFYTRIISPEELKEFQSKKDFKRELTPLDKMALPQKNQKIKPNALTPGLRALPRQKKNEINKDIPKKLDQEKKSFSSPSEKAEKPSIIPETSTKKEDIDGKGESTKQSKDRPKDKLFDKEIIGKLAQKEREAKPDNSITFSTKEYQYQGYMQRLKEKIEGIWRYPRDAAERGIYGDLYIRFTIKKNGKLGAVDLIRTSGYKSLDDAAIKALRDAEPYWPLPDEWGRDGLTITGHFVYTHYGSYIR